MISASAIGSFNSLPTPGNVGPGEIFEDADQEAADHGAERAGQAAEHGRGKAVDQARLTSCFRLQETTTGAISMPAIEPIAAAMPQPSADHPRCVDADQPR